MEKLFLVIVVVLFSIFWDYIENSSANNIVLSYCVLLVSLLLIIKSRNNINLLSIYSLLFYFNYSIVMPNYINNKNISFFISWSNEEVSHLGIKILFLFMLSILIFFPNKINFITKEKNEYLKHGEKRKSVVPVVLLFLLIGIYFLAFKKPDIIGERGQPNALYEYSIVLFIIGFYFWGNTKIIKNIILVLLCIFAAQNFIYGGRIIGIQLILVFLVMFYYYKLNIAKLFPIAFLSFLLLTVIGLFRGKAELNLENLLKAKEYLETRMLALDTAYSAYFTSLTFLKVAGQVTIFERIDLLLRFMLSNIIGGGRVENASLPIYTRKFYIHYYGGIFPHYFFFYLGKIGVFLSAIIISFYTRILNKKYSSLSDLKKCINVYFIVTTFRWYLYSPLTILRGVLILIIAYYFFYVLIKLEKTIIKLQLKLVK